MSGGNLRVQGAETQPQKVGGGMVGSRMPLVKFGVVTSHILQLGFVHERWGRIQKAGGDYSCLFFTDQKEMLEKFVNLT